MILWHIGPQGDFPKALRIRCYSPSQVAEILLSWLGVTELPEEHQNEGPSKATGRVPPLTTENEDALSFLGTCQEEQWAPLAGVTAHADLDGWADFRS